jgi:hypothetical protein
MTLATFPGARSGGVAAHRRGTSVSHRSTSMHESNIQAGRFHAQDESWANGLGRRSGNGSFPSGMVLFGDRIGGEIRQKTSVKAVAVYYVQMICYFMLSKLNTGYSAEIFSNSAIGASLLTGICGRAPGACFKNAFKMGALWLTSTSFRRTCSLIRVEAVLFLCGEHSAPVCILAQHGTRYRSHSRPSEPAEN